MTTPDKQKWRVLFDLNVILDVLMQREPHFADATRLWALAETGQIQGLVAAHSLTTLFYLYRRQSSHGEAYQRVRQLLSVFDVAGVDQQVIITACDLGWQDFEDAVQAAAAQMASCDYLVTRNTNDFGHLPVQAIHPADFLAVWAAIP